MYDVPELAHIARPRPVNQALEGITGLGRRLPTRVALATELAAYEQARNRTADPIRWTFTNEKARAKLHRLYPSNPS